MSAIKIAHDQCSWHTLLDATSIESETAAEWYCGEIIGVSSTVRACQSRIVTVTRDHRDLGTPFRGNRPYTCNLSSSLFDKLLIRSDRPVRRSGLPRSETKRPGDVSRGTGGCRFHPRSRWSPWARVKLNY